MAGKGKEWAASKPRGGPAMRVSSSESTFEDPVSGSQTKDLSGLPEVKEVDSSEEVSEEQLNTLS